VRPGLYCMKVLQNNMYRTLLLTAGIVASLLYAILNIAVLHFWPEYSAFYQTVSELSAINAPTRELWLPWGIAYALLMAVFGIGMLQMKNQKKPLRIAGWLFIAYGLLSTCWPPMHQRDVLAAGGETVTDKLHLVFAGVTVLLMVLQISFAMAAMKKAFRIYSVITLIVLMTFGLLTSMQAPDVNKNFPTPWIGVWERLDIGAYLIWVIVLAILLIKKSRKEKWQNS
jgi:hypothetical protein